MQSNISLFNMFILLLLMGLLGVFLRQKSDTLFAKETFIISPTIYTTLVDEISSVEQVDEEDEEGEGDGEEPIISYNSNPTIRDNIYMGYRTFLIDIGYITTQDDIDIFAEQSETTRIKTTIFENETYLIMIYLILNDVLIDLDSNTTIMADFKDYITLDPSSPNDTGRDVNIYAGVDIREDEGIQGILETLNVYFDSGMDVYRYLHVDRILDKI